MLDSLHARLARRPPSPFFEGGSAAGAPSKRYLIATTGRSGSTFLCSRIAEYGALGFPMEFLNESYVAEFDRVFPTPSLTDYERYLARAFASKGGVFGLKTDFWRFQTAQRLGFLTELIQPLDLIVHLWREDFVAQAVSQALAAETNVWHGREVDSDDLGGVHSAVEYDERKIELAARNLLNQEYYWRRFFARSGAPVLDLVYEEISGDVDGAVGEIAAALKIELAPPPPSADAIRRTRSDTAREWRERFCAKRGEFVRYWKANRGVLTASPP